MARAGVRQLDVGAVSDPFADVLGHPVQRIVAVERDPQAAVDRIGDELETANDQADLDTASGQVVQDLPVLDGEGSGAQDALQAVREEAAVGDPTVGNSLGADAVRRGYGPDRSTPGSRSEGRSRCGPAGILFVRK